MVKRFTDKFESYQILSLAAEAVWNMIEQAMYEQNNFSRIRALHQLKFATYLQSIHQE